MRSDRRKQVVLGGVAVVLLGAAAYLIFFRAGDTDTPATAAAARADEVSKAMQSGGADTAAPPEIERPATRGAVNPKGTR